MNKQGCCDAITRILKSNKARMALAAIILFSVTAICQAKEIDPADKEELKRRSQAEAWERQRKGQEKDVFLQQQSPAEKTTVLPPEEPSFLINDLVLEGDKVDHFSWAKNILNQYHGQRVGKQGINLIVKRLTEAFIDKGYVTTRIGIPEQDLSTGTLKLTLIPGTIRHIRFADPAMRGNWQTAFPTRPGDLLNLRNIEQGLEQMKRVPSQDVDFKIAPGGKPGESDILITLKQAKPWKLLFALDNSGSRETGKLQSSVTAAVDNLFGINDLFNVSFNKDVDREDQFHGTRGSSLYYSFPYGYWTFTLAANSYNYHQNIQGYNQTFTSSGKSDSQELRIQRLIRRDQTSKTSLEFRVSRKETRSYIDDTEIEVQRKKVTVAQAALLHRLYRGQTVIDAELAYKWGTPWFHAQTDLEYFPETTRYKIWTADINLTTPVKIGNREGRYSLELRGQTTRDTLFPSEFFSIGNRYTVRGFDGEQTLTAEQGWYLRNELGMPLNQKGDEVYLGLDYGRVYGPYTQYLAGTELAGMTLGFRGQVKNGSYDVFAGRPVKKPAGYKTENLTFGFNLTYLL
ncbi:hemolysin transporter protein ShlB precursor [Methylomusa anaerophila]|uniref:Hemolysin transporter protein ShlB n=3 Tax=Methylomusa anaerophila TaxID=1930071 RepID=A0A348AF45_9FIRM|nr:hemolysin transporter protein ShlB precursor [Methylomusa anaerophila]